MSRLNVLVLTGACDGAGLINVLHPTERAPVWGVVGAVRQVWVREVEAAYTTFYQTLFSTFDGGKATQAMNAAVPAGDSPFRFYGAEAIFQFVFKRYMETYSTPAVLDARIDRLVASLPTMLEGDQLLAFKMNARAYLNDQRPVFDRIKEHHFFTDLCPENSRRFTVNFDDASNSGP